MSHNLRPRNQAGQFIINFDNQIRFDAPSSDSSSSSSLVSSTDTSDSSTNNNPPPIQVMAFHLNPFNGDINPSNADGQKLFLKATEERKDDKQMKIDQSNVKLIMTAFESDARKFGWGSLVNLIPFDAIGGTRSILLNFTEVHLDEVMKQARTTWGDTTARFEDDLPANLVCQALDPATTLAHVPRFHRRVRAGMIAKRIEGSLNLYSLFRVKIY